MSFLYWAYDLDTSEFCTNGKFYASKQFKCVLWSFRPVTHLSRFEVFLRAKWFESFEIFLAIGKNNLPSLGIRSQSAKRSAVLKVMGLGSVDIRYSAEQPLQAFRALSAVAADAPLWRPPDSSSCICMSPSCCYLFCSLKTTFPLYTYTYAISKVFEEMLSCINICIYMYE